MVATGSTWVKRRSATDADDMALIRRVARQDREAFEALYRRYYPRVFGYLLRLSRRPDLVEEVVDDVMVVVWQSARRFRGHSKLSSWIFGIAYRKGMKALKKAGRFSVEVPVSEAMGIAAGASPDADLSDKERSHRVQAALATLSPEQRSAMELTYFHGYSYPEIAEITGCPVNTVKTRMFHARRRLRGVLPALGFGPPAPENGGLG